MKLNQYCYFETCSSIVKLILSFFLAAFNLNKKYLQYSSQNLHRLVYTKDTDSIKQPLPKIIKIIKKILEIIFYKKRVLKYMVLKKIAKKLQIFNLLRKNKIYISHRSIVPERISAKLRYGHRAKHYQKQIEQERIHISFIFSFFVYLIKSLLHWVY